MSNTVELVHFGLASFFFNFESAVVLQALKLGFAALTLVSTSIKHFNTLPKSKKRVFVCVVTSFTLLPSMLLPPLDQFCA